MSKQSLRQWLGALVPSGLLGLSVALAPPADAAVQPPQPRAKEDVATRLERIRVTVSQAAGDAVESGDVTNPNVQRVWWGNGGGWRNGGGWGWRNGGGWGNWHPGWGNGWHNGGWGNWHPGWGNGGWGNFHPGWGNWHPWLNL